MILRLIKAFKNKAKVYKYNKYSIASHFREQGAQIGEDCVFGIRNLGTEPFLVKIGNHVGIASGVLFLTHGLGWIYRDKIPDLQVFGKIEIKDNCNIGVNTIILPNVTIGENSMIGAGSIVTKDIPPNSIVAGVPAKVIGNTNDYFDIAKKSWQLQKPDGYMSELIIGKKYTPSYMDALRSSVENRSLLRKHLTKLFWGQEL